ncbi:hypothetical protein GCM10009634_58830 [Saccharothrix xinjiangensis]
MRQDDDNQDVVEDHSIEPTTEEQDDKTLVEDDEGTDPATEPAASGQGKKNGGPGPQSRLAIN